MRSIAGKAVEVVDDARGLFDRTALCDPHSGYQHRVDRVEQAAVPVVRVDDRPVVGVVQV